MSNFTFISKLKITQKISCSYGAVITLIIMLGAFNLYQLSSVSDIFTNYRGLARGSLLMSNMSEDFAEARIAALKYRLNNKSEYVAEVTSNIQEISEQKSRIAELINDPKERLALSSLTTQAQQYGKVFEETVAKQNQLNNYAKTIEADHQTLLSQTQKFLDQTFANNKLAQLLYGARLQKNYMVSYNYIQKYLTQNDIVFYNNAVQSLQAVQKDILKLKETSLSAQQSEQIKTIKKDVSAIEKHLVAINKETILRDAFYTEGLDKIGPEILNGYDRIFESIEAKQNIKGPEAVSLLNNISMSVVMLSGIIAVICTAISLIMTRFLKKNFTLITAQMMRLANGEKSFLIKGLGQKDEIGDVAAALQVFKENAVKMDMMQKEQEYQQEKQRALEEEQRKIEEKQREKEAEQAIERKNALIQMADKFENRVGAIVRHVTSSASDLQQMAATLSQSVDETTSQSKAVVQASCDADGNVQTVASATEELSASIQEISSNVKDTAQFARECAAKAEISQEQLKKLQKSIHEINGVIQAISSVASQTNLLALNASIEAARAGKAGKGFSVVANEVKSLSSQTHDMTDEISKKIEFVRSNAEETIRSVSDILKQVMMVDSKANYVAGAVLEQNNATEEISRNVQEAANGTQIVSHNIEKVQQGTDNSAAATHQLKAASDDLADQAAHLTTALNGFLNEVRTG